MNNPRLVVAMDEYRGRRNYARHADTDYKQAKENELEALGDLVLAIAEHLINKNEE